MIWLAFALMTAAVLSILLVPLLRARAAAPARATYDLAVYKDQLAEIDRDLERGVLTGDQADAARVEVQRRLLAAADAAKNAAKAVATRRPLAAAAAIAVGVPGLAFGLYAMLGSPTLPDQPFSARAEKVAAIKAQAAQFQGMADKLAARLQQQPNDGQGWAMLGRSLAVLGKPDEARDAYEKALPLLPGNVTVRLEYSGILLNDVPDNAPFPPRFVEVMREVLALDPENPKALFFVGVAEAQDGHPDKARALLSKLLASLPADSPEHAEVQQQLDAIK